jgi:transcriptional regulator with XRE-family HTH domain
MPENQNIVGPVIRELREKKGMTQPQLVAKLNIAGWDLSRGTFSKIEAQIRCVTDDEIFKLAAGLGIEAADLIRLAAKKRRPSEGRCK